MGVCRRLAPEKANKVAIRELAWPVVRIALGARQLKRLMGVGQRKEEKERVRSK